MSSQTDSLAQQASLELMSKEVDFFGTSRSIPFLSLFGP